jgi:hypothetical protein
MPRTTRISQDAGRSSPYELRAQTSLTRNSPYTPIDSENGGIRLVEIEPGKFDDPIVMRFIQSNLVNGSHAYEALSYVWGTEFSTSRVIVDEKPITITANLECALRHLRFTVLKRILWIDAISMNQKDTQERNHQVQIMGRIYSTARAVIVWLGAVDKEEIHQKIVLEAMQFHFSERSPSIIMLFNYMLNTISIMHEVAGDLLQPKNCLLLALEQIVTRPWFSRIWVRNLYL